MDHFILSRWQPTLTADKSVVFAALGSSLT